MNWIKERVGITEPIYGPSAIQTVTEQAKTVPYTELTRDDLRWYTWNSTCVETQTFYISANEGYSAMAQVIYNSLAGIRTTCQFNCKIFYPGDGGDRETLWASDTLENWRVSDDKTCFFADSCKIELAEDGASYTIKSSISRQAVVDIKFTKLAPGFAVGKDGTSYYGTDPSQPWGRMRHVFWPRCRVEGNIITPEAILSMDGLGLFIHALQGMRPNLAAASWNFINFQAPTYSAVMMEFTTPPSYGSTVVTVGGVVKDGEIICAGANTTAAHTSSKEDTEVGWPEPESVSFKWHKSPSSGDGEGGGELVAEIEGPMGERMDRVDVLAQIPKFLKVIIAQAAGSKPYIYQFGPRMSLKVKTADGEVTEEGTVFMEATFITG